MCETNSSRQNRRFYLWASGYSPHAAHDRNAHAPSDQKKGQIITAFHALGSVSRECQAQTRPQSGSQLLFLSWELSVVPTQIAAMLGRSNNNIEGIVINEATESVSAGIPCRSRTGSFCTDVHAVGFVGSGEFTDFSSNQGTSVMFPG